MSRTIHQLLAAEAAGEPLTPEEVERLTQHKTDAIRTAVRLANAPLEEWETFAERRDEYEELRAEVLQRIATTNDSGDLRGLVLWLLDALGLAFDQIAELQGRKRAPKRSGGTGGQRSAATRREKSAAPAILDVIENIKARHAATNDDPLSDKAAARMYLAEKDPTGWTNTTAAAQQQKVNALVKQIGRARKGQKRPVRK